MVGYLGPFSFVRRYINVARGMIPKFKEANQIHVHHENERIWIFPRPTPILSLYSRLP